MKTATQNWKMKEDTQTLSKFQKGILKHNSIMYAKKLTGNKLILLHKNTTKYYLEKTNTNPISTENQLQVKVRDSSSWGKQKIAVKGVGDLDKL